MTMNYEEGLNRRVSVATKWKKMKMDRKKISLGRKHGAASSEQIAKINESLEERRRKNTNSDGVEKKRRK